MIVGPAGEAAHPVGVAGPSAQHDHGQLRIDARGESVGRAHPVEHLEAAPVLQPEVKHHERRLAHLDRPQALPHAAGADRREPVRGQVLQQEGARDLVVLDDQHTALLSE